MILSYRIRLSALRYSILITYRSQRVVLVNSNISAVNCGIKKKKEDIKIICSIVITLDFNF
jgi:hypothetical protein